VIAGVHEAAQLVEGCLRVAPDRIIVGEAPRRNITDGLGLNVELKAIPVSGKLVIRRHEANRKAK
jgi:hypothetical protein